MQKALPALQSSLVAGVCTVCVAASVGAVAPTLPTHTLTIQAAATHQTYAEKYYLTAASDPLTAVVGGALEIPTLLWQDFSAVSVTIGKDIVIPLMAPFTQFFNAITTGNVTALIPALISDIQALVAGVGDLFQLPGRIITANLASIGGLFGAAAVSASATPAAATPAAAIAVPPAVTGALTSLFTIPAVLWQDFSAVSVAIGKDIVIPLLAPFTQFFNAITTGNVTALIPGLISDAQALVAGVGDLFQLPGRIITYSLNAIGHLFGAAATSASATAAITTAPKALTATASTSLKAVAAASTKETVDTKTTDDKSGSAAGTGSTASGDTKTDTKTDTKVDVKADPKTDTTPSTDTTGAGAGKATDDAKGDTKTDTKPSTDTGKDGSKSSTDSSAGSTSSTDDSGVKAPKTSKGGKHRKSDSSSSSSSSSSSNSSSTGASDSGSSKGGKHRKAA